MMTSRSHNPHSATVWQSGKSEPSRKSLRLCEIWQMPACSSIRRLTLVMTSEVATTRGWVWLLDNITDSCTPVIVKQKIWLYFNFLNSNENYSVIILNLKSISIDWRTDCRYSYQRLFIELDCFPEVQSYGKLWRTNKRASRGVYE